MIAGAGIAFAWLGRMRRPLWILVSLLALGLWLWAQQVAPAADTPDEVPARVFSLAGAPSAPAHGRADDSRARLAAFLPEQAGEVLQRIARGGPFEYRQDGSVFQNREHRLPSQPRGYYHEYTVATPGSPDRGARRIITGGSQGEVPREYWYTGDHYRSFQRFEVSP